MAELLIAYSMLSLAAFPFNSHGFMPFQDNYWLWKGVGFSGLFAFSARWVVQWLYSEKHKESIIPVAFWWLSMIGASLELLYFVRQLDSVGICGCAFNVIPYSRNLILIYRKRRNDAQAAQVLDPLPSSPVPEPLK